MDWLQSPATQDYLRNLFRERYPWNLFREKMISRIPFFHGYFLLSKKVSVKPFFERGRTLRASQSIIAYSRAVLSLLPREISFLVGSAAASCRFFFNGFCQSGVSLRLFSHECVRRTTRRRLLIGFVTIASERCPLLVQRKSTRLAMRSTLRLRAVAICSASSS